MKTTEQIEKLRNEIPNRADTITYLHGFFKSNKEPNHLQKIIDQVAEFFGVSEEAYNLQLEELGLTGHAKSVEATLLDSIVGFAVRKLYEDGELKRVDPNTYESISGPDKEMVDSPAMRAARTRYGMSFVDDSVKRMLSFSKYANDEVSLICELVDGATGKSNKWTVEMVERSLEHVKKLTA